MQGNIHMLTADQVNLLRLHKEDIISILQQAASTDTPILPVEKQLHYELSYAQKRIWVLSQLNGGGLAYHITMANTFEGELNTAYLAAAFNGLIERHEILRTVFKEDESRNIRQYILDASQLNFSITNFDLRTDSEKECKAEQIIQEAQQQVFDFEKGPLIRATLIRCSNNRWVFHVVMHHIISDGWSMDLLVRELMKSYTLLCQGKNDWSPPLHIQYKDYAHWQYNQVAGETYARHRTYWLQQLEGRLPVLQLPGDIPRPTVKTYKGASINRHIDESATAVLKALLRQHDCTLFMGLIALVQVLLYRYTSQEDIIIGTPVAGREQAALQEQMGLYMNTVALRTSCDGADSYLQLLASVKQLAIDAQAHQAYPFDLLVNELSVQYDRSRNVLFDAMVTLKEDDFTQVQAQWLPGNLRITPYTNVSKTLSKFDWSFNFIDYGNSIAVEVIYNTDIYTLTTAERLANHLIRILIAIVNDPVMPVSDLQYLSLQEVQQLLITFNNSSSHFPSDKTVVHLFREQVQRTPETPALVFGTISLTYKELDEKTNALAQLLVTSYSMQSEEPVAIMIDRSQEMIIGILAILKAGGAYVPVDPEYPAARIGFILKDCSARILLTTSHYLPQLAAYKGAIIAIDRPMESMHVNTTGIPATISPGSLAYVIYTSGSTGQPKGVMISHQSLVDYFYGILQRTNIAKCRHFGLVSTIAADLGNTVIYTSLLQGGTLHLYTVAELSDTEQIFNEQIDCIKIVPSHWKSLQAPGKVFLPRQCLIFGGESLTPDVLEKIKGANSACHVYNHYGPSETTIGKLVSRIDPDHIPVPVPLGSPFCQSSFYILDRQRKLVPVGVIGEICIAGAGLARGYWNHPELTAEKFIPNPFKEGDRIYTTGDMGRWLPDGTIEFAGRKDEQLKIRGYRVEPGEIEAVLRQHSHIEAAVVLAKSNAGGEKELVAYLVAKDGQALPDVRTWLQHMLPAWMIPAHYILLKKIPLTLNGKIDRTALPDITEAPPAVNTIYIAPRNNTEQELVYMWQELLGKTEIGIQHNFFDLGGHSLKMMQLISRINSHFSIRINIQSLYKAPTIENISGQIDFILDQNRQKANRRHLKQVEL